MAIKGAQRGNPFVGAELRDEVRKHCLTAFEERFGKPWEERWEVRLGYDPDYPTARQVTDRRKLERKLSRTKTESEDRAACEQLREAMHVVRERSKRGADGGEATAFLRAWVPEQITAALLDSIPTRWAKGLGDRRALLVATLDSYNVFQEPDGVDGGSSFLDARDFGVVSLLVGNWPRSMKTAKRGTVAEILALETADMHHHIKKHGAARADPETGKAKLIPKRGPKYRKKPKHEK